MPNKLKATPGPYKAEAYNKRMGSLISHGDISTGKTMGIVFAKLDETEARANAHLLAASWDLYHALEACRQLMEKDGWIGKEMVNARAALSKARGEQ